MQELVDEGIIAGAVTLVAQAGRTLQLDAVGFVDLATREAMRTDSLFAVVSMTKPFTATAILSYPANLTRDSWGENFLGPSACATPRFGQPAHRFGGWQRRMPEQERLHG